MITCGFTPFFLAFPDLVTTNITIFDNCMNAIFFIDLITNFFSAFHDEDFEIVDAPSVRISVVVTHSYCCQ